MVDFIKLVLKFTIIMFIIMALIFGGLLIYRAVTGREIKTPDIFDSKKPKTVLIAGLHPDGPLTDFIMIAKYNPETGNINAISIPRDTKVTGTVDNKINSAYARKRDIEALKSKVNEVTSLTVDNYVVLDTASVKKMVDAIGGIPMDVPINMNYDDEAQDLHIHLSKGYQTLDGDKAEQFIRFRKNNDGTGYANGDVERIQAQQKFIKAAVNAALKPATLTKLPELINLGIESVKTDINVGDVLGYLDDIKKFNKDNLRLETLPGEGMYIGPTSYYVCDRAKTEKLIKEMFIEDTVNVAKEDGKPNGSTSSGTEPSQKTNINEVDKSKITIEVLNATSKSGLASKVAEKLKDEGYNVTKIGNYKTTTEVLTSVINRNGNNYAKEIKTFLGKGKVKNEEDSSSKVDVTIILGSDY